MRDTPTSRRSPSPSEVGIPVPILGSSLSRRELLKLGGSAAAAAAFLAACGTTNSGSTSASGGTVSVGSNHSDPAELKGIQAINAAFTKATGTKVKLNTVDHNTFQDQISSYLQGTPQDVFSWFSGHRMRFFANQGLATAVDDVWNNVKDHYTSAFATAVTGDDGKIYGVPVDYYPWAVFYRKSVLQQHNWTVPTNWDDFKSLSSKMKAAGLTPIAMGDKDGWPAQGTFDILNLRLNGYDFHIRLVTGKEKWTDSKVTNVFKKWAEIVPYYTSGFAGLTWQQAADTLVRKQSGMKMFGLFISQEFSATNDPADLNDLDFFAFPDMGTQYDGEKALDAPIDIVMMSAKSRTLNADKAQAKSWMQFYGRGSTQLLMFQNAAGFIPTAKDVDTSSYSALQKKAAQIVGQAQKITQFFDRDSRPDFAGANGMQSFLHKFLANPTANTSGLQKDMQSFWDSLPPEA
ncbi:MAG: carbohydrate ABC transporter substrate-binding protein [Chloroflexi bacterium]|nr:MAG: carbohydrate ABC transporter substrate-binding protein [Chloroflexota bacterium]TME55632.1 MAG: carbohydrate ABC transporter substrate-binding protein [Chloroflexota bacterium]